MSNYKWKQKQKLSVHVHHQLISRFINVWCGIYSIFCSHALYIFTFHSKLHFEENKATKKNEKISNSSFRFTVSIIVLFANFWWNSILIVINIWVPIFRKFLSSFYHFMYVFVMCMMMCMTLAIIHRDKGTNNDEKLKFYGL